MVFVFIFLATPCARNSREIVALLLAVFFAEFFLRVRASESLEGMRASYRVSGGLLPHQLEQMLWTAWAALRAKQHPRHEEAPQQL